MKTDFNCKWLTIGRFNITFLKLVLKPIIILCSNTMEVKELVLYLIIPFSDILTITKDKEPCLLDNTSHLTLQVFLAWFLTNESRLINKKKIANACAIFYMILDRLFFYSL